MVSSTAWSQSPAVDLIGICLLCPQARYYLQAQAITMVPFTYKVATTALLAFWPCLLSAAPLPVVKKDPAALPVLKTNRVNEFPEGTWLENLVFRQRDGNAVTTLLSEPSVYLMSTNSSFPLIQITSSLLFWDTLASLN